MNVLIFLLFLCWVSIPIIYFIFHLSASLFFKSQFGFELCNLLSIIFHDVTMYNTNAHTLIHSQTYTWHTGYSACFSKSVFNRYSFRGVFVRDCAFATGAQRLRDRLQTPSSSRVTGNHDGSLNRSNTLGLLT